ncbi:MAG: hypothetical protein A2V86_05145 [Deltaproteobacteria bacterium RBG_16_49_23]|nr:MAG: hypothetical protein A2V86_05145 [Deltaproteobacteria bacterium RBG_16_49_23]
MISEFGLRDKDSYGKERIERKNEIPKVGHFSTFSFRIPCLRWGFGGQAQSAIRGSCMMKNLISGLKYSEIRNWGRFRVFHSAIRIPKSAIGIRGFTLIEIIILIVMAGILLPVIIVPFVTGVKGSQKPEMTATATYLAHQKMEEFMKYRYLDSALNPIAMTSYADISGFSGYQWQWERLYVDSDFLNPDLVTHRGYKRILVRVKDPMNDTYEIYSVVAFSP